MKKVFFLPVFYLFLTGTTVSQILKEGVTPENPKIVFTEISYNPPEHGTDSLEYIELYNNNTVSVDLENFYFSEGVQYTFPSIVAAPHSFILVAKNASAMLNTFGVTALQWTSGSLSNSGELIRLKDAANGTVDSVFYDTSSPWDPFANGQGPSLELCDPDLPGEEGSNWRHAIEFQTINADGDSVWGSPGLGCSYFPVAGFEASDTVVNTGDSVMFTNTSEGDPVSWEWTFEGGIPGNFSGENPPAIHYNSQGLFSVTLAVSNTMGNDTLVRHSYIDVGTTGISTSEIKPSFIIYPNPNYGKFLLILKVWRSYDVKVFSLVGDVLFQKTCDRENMMIDLSGHHSGLYFLLVINYTTNNQITAKLVIK